MSRRTRPGRFWAFRWFCPNCENDRDFLVSELDLSLDIWSRCSTCTRLLRVQPEHRAQEISGRSRYTH